MRRKQGTLNPLSPAALSDSSEGPKSPASTGAMDDLLQKLRAAKPEAKDQRDRRRRARLKDKHQVRVASGQKIPELGVNMEDEEGSVDGGKGILSPTSEGGESVESAAITSPTDATGSDVADRAAAMLEGLQGGPSALNKDGSLNVRRRRENADNERERRRRRRQQASTASSARSEDGALMSPTTIAEEDGEEAARTGSVVSGDGTDDGPGTPITIVHPPSPESKRDEGKRLPTPPPES
jgi:cytokinesis protein